VSERSVEQRLHDLEDRQAIVDLLNTYGHGLDYGLTEVFVDLWTDDGVWQLPIIDPFNGLDEIRAHHERVYAPPREHRSKHCVVEPLIEVDGDEARVDSYFFVLVFEEKGPLMRSYGRYRDQVVRCPDGRWRFRRRDAELECVI
jgi:hypothetical protein